MKNRVLKGMLLMASAGLIAFAGQYGGYENRGPVNGYAPQHSQKQWQKGRRSGNIMLKAVLRRIHRQLDLSEEQEEKIRYIVSSERKKMRKEIRELRKKRKKERVGSKRNTVMDFSKFMTADKFYPEAFKKALEEKRKIMLKRREQIHEMQLEHTAETMKRIFDVLTVTQRKELLRCN